MSGQSEIGIEVRRVARELGVDLAPGYAEVIERLVGLWGSYSRSMNLTGARTVPELIPHIHDGIGTVAAACRAMNVSTTDATVRWLDIGSGGGFPGLVVAAVTSWNVTLVEPRSKRASFLDMALHAIGREGCLSVCGRLESGVVVGLDGELGRYDFVSARAVWSPEDWLLEAAKCEAVHGAVVAHLRVGAPNPLGLRPVGLAEVGDSSIRCYSVEQIATS